MKLSAQFKLHSFVEMPLIWTHLSNGPNDNYLGSIVMHLPAFRISPVKLQLLQAEEFINLGLPFSYFRVLSQSDCIAHLQNKSTLASGNPQHTQSAKFT